jgi:crotonobetainyl-CoA:carnitine CoA-transferase CaiB-like acyl-CoA transferase
MSTVASVDAMTNVGPLAGIVVLDASDNVSGMYAGQLLADLGAEVVRIPDGDGVLSLLSTSDARLRRALLRNRITVAAQADFESLLRRSDVLLAPSGEGGTGVFDEPTSLRVQPDLIRCTISPFGIDSPWADRAGDDLIVQALAGAMEITGEPGRPPVRMGAPVLALMAGSQAAVAVLASLLEKSRRGSRTIDVSLLDVSLSMLSYLAPMYLTLGEVPARVGSGHPTIYPYNAFEVADGYLVVAPFTGRFWRKFCEVLGVPEWGTDERFRNFQDRLDNRHVLEPLLNERMAGKTRSEWLALLEAGDVPCGPVNDVSEALAMEQTKARAMVVEVESAGEGTTTALGLPLKITNADGRRFEPTYRDARVAVLPTSSPTSAVAVYPGVADRSSSTRGPLAGISVLDLTRMAAGPFCAEMLSDLGAVVTKVEEPQIGDPTRRNVPMIDGLSSYFLSFNRGKRSVSIDMKAPEGRDTVLALLAEADVVVENFRPGVMERLGLDYDVVKTLNERIVFASISGFGQTGPLRLKTSFDLVNQAVAGMLSITGEAERAPVRLGLPVGDLAGGQYAALGIVAALVQRERNGVGAYVDVSLHDVLITLLGGLALDTLSGADVPGRLGSEYLDRTPAGVFEAADGYLALEAWTDESWSALVAKLNDPVLGDDRFADRRGRHQYREEVRDVLATIVRERTVAEWVAISRNTSVGIAPVLDVGRALDSEHAAARQLVLDIPLPSGGRARTVGSAFHIDGRAVVSAGGPPALGEHNAELLENLPNLQAN